VVPSAERLQLVQERHALPAGGHFGVDRVCDSLRRDYYWPRLEDTVGALVRSCEVCARRQGQGRHTKPPLHPIVTPDQPLDLMGMDVLKIGPTTAGPTRVLVFKDYLTRFLWAYPIQNEQAATIAEVMVNQLFPAFGLPRQLLSDRGASFMGKLMARLMLTYGVKQLFTSPGHPKTDGMVERAHQTLLNVLAKATVERGGDWMTHLGTAVLAYNCSPHASTGITPMEGMFGRKAMLPSSSVMSLPPIGRDLYNQHWIDRLSADIRVIWRKTQAESVKKAAIHQKYYNRNRDAGLKISAGDLVWVHYPADRFGSNYKLASTYRGPYCVLSTTETGAAKLKRVNAPEREQPITVNHDRLRPCSAEIEAEYQEEQPFSLFAPTYHDMRWK
jgi:transposase InsO family protein